ncbi:DNA-binding IclR family transcriptional regulator [Streptosporangium becharense]|uniref:Glycerol operon regulatory protein n=1 Tax=Streptosporangium becharense TaxID=1816182 RepID=A0A7W9MJQ1_9ACTN|nr:IclR family transcriptional regulator [Streptosporangium becharense]MBB2915135.1 DNA-binding IclR family transcriptional regulator [Streptosporangium becharense]MBB5822793.1 DNA-binding IclR family transcriptional regulator [Streptosporangium becharense]
MASDQSNNQSVERAISVLRAFLTGRPELRVSDVAKATGLGTSTASRLLATLETLEFVERDPISGLYRLGTAPITLGGVALNQNPVHREARQVAQELAASVGLGVNVAIRQGDSLFYLLNFEGRLAPRPFVLTGQRKPLYATGIGKCLLLALSGEERRALVPEETMQPFTAHTITTHARLDEELAAVLSRGYAKEVEELAFGRACVAAPIRDRSGAVVAAISISGPLSAIDLATREAELASTVIETADSISIGLGYVGPVSAFAMSAS